MERKEIENCLRDLPIAASSAFAARVALRVLPLLAQMRTNAAQHQAFWFWHREERAQHLLAVLAACNMSLLGAFGKKGLAVSVYAAAAAARAALDDDAACAAAVYAAAYAAAAAAHAAASDAGAQATYAAAADAAAYANAAATAYAAATDHDHFIFNEITHDLNLLLTLSIDNFLAQPLWSKGIPAAWQLRVDGFKADALSLQAGFEYWLDWYDARCRGVALDGAFLERSNQIPEAISAQGALQINAYLRNLSNQSAAQPLNRVRAIFIGNGDAGKTSLIRVLHDEPVIEGRQPMTPGIEIREWNVPDSEIKAHFWDFGGQVMVHATHQLFLRDACLYVLVLCARSEINATEQAEYWLEHVKSFGKNAPVMIVGNRADQVALNLDMGSLKQKYPNIVNFFPVSCTQAQGEYRAQAGTFRQEFCRQLKQLGTHQMLFTQAQFAVLQSLRRMTLSASFLSHRDFEDLCSAHGVGEEGPQNRAWLLDVLDKLGVIIHFPQLPFMDGYVLNPRWLTYGVYTLMYCKQPSLTNKQIIHILSQEKVMDEAGNTLAYPPEKCRLIMDAMREFKLCYSLPDQPDTLIIPALLSANAPDASVLTFDKTDALAFEFVFAGFLPRHVLPELIVSQHRDIQTGMIWQYGVALAHRTLKGTALLQVDYHLRTLFIWVAGQEARDYLMLLRNEIEKILSRLAIHYDELITLSGATRIGRDRLALGAEEKAFYRQILAHERQSIAQFIAVSGEMYDVGKVLKRFVPDTARAIETNHHFYGSNVTVISGKQASMRQQHINISGATINGNVVSADQIHDSLNQLATTVAPDDVKTLLHCLLIEIRSLQTHIATAQQADLDGLVEEAQNIITETARTEPRQRWYRASMDGIFEIAQKLGCIAQPLLDIARKLDGLFQSLKA